MVTELSNHINNPSIRFLVYENLGIEPNMKSPAPIVTRVMAILRIWIRDDGHLGFLGQNDVVT